MKLSNDALQKMRQYKIGDATPSKEDGTLREIVNALEMLFGYERFKAFSENLHPLMVQFAQPFIQEKGPMANEIRPFTPDEIGQFEAQVS